MSSIATALVLALSVFFGVRLHNSNIMSLRKPLPMLIWDIIARVKDKKPALKQIPPNTPHFGEKPHYFTPPSDMEQFRIRGRKKPFKSLLMGEVNDQQLQQHVYIPYPNDPPHTFPSIKARALFTKSPKKLHEVYIPSADTVDRSYLQRGAKLRVPFNQLEERFRTVYTNAERNGLNIAVNARDEADLREWERLGYLRQQDEVYDFHNVDGLVSPPLTEIATKAEIWESQ
jgi:hypothetical protein